MTIPIPVANTSDIAQILDTPLTVNDRCDRCNVQAFVRASFLVHATGKMVDLLFCAHHFRQFREHIDAVAMHVQDDTDNIR